MVNAKPARKPTAKEVLSTPQPDSVRLLGGCSCTTKIAGANGSRLATLPPSEADCNRSARAGLLDREIMRRCHGISPPTIRRAHEPRTVLALPCCNGNQNQTVTMPSPKDHLKSALRRTQTSRRRAEKLQPAAFATHHKWSGAFSCRERGPAELLIHRPDCKRVLNLISCGNVGGIRGHGMGGVNGASG